MTPHRSLVLTVLCAAPVAVAACMTPPGLRSPGTQADGAQGGPGRGHDSVPYAYRNVKILGGGFVTGIIFSPTERGLVYARTDIGGAYRLDAGSEVWVPITDHLSRADANSMGIESLALDPTDGNKVYLATGTYTKSWAGVGAMLRSRDRGKTWESTPLSIKMGGNEWGRSCGERLAVDPNLPTRLLFGSRQAGLMESRDGGVSWTPTPGLPAGTGNDPIGVTAVVFDAKSGKPGSATPVIYAAADHPEGSVFRSKDGGKTWASLPGQPAKLMACHLELDSAGTVFVSYGNNPGPNDVTDGAVYSLDPETGRFTDITPLRPSKEDAFGYAGLSAAGQKPGVVVVTTIDRWTNKDEIFRTTDGGKVWKRVGSTATYDVNGAQYVYWHRDKLEVPHWMGDIDIDPFDPNRAMFVTGAGLWTTHDLEAADADKPVKFRFTNEGLEETAVGVLVSPPEGPPLLSGVGDICGFRHDDLDVAPPRGAYDTPSCSGTTGLDFAEQRPSTVVRVGRVWGQEPHGAISTDGGATWKPFGSEPKGSETGGMVAISADAKSILWAVKGAPPVVSRDGGKTWTPVKGVRDSVKLPDWSALDLQPTADRVNPARFAIYDAVEGVVYMSSDGGATFAEGARTLPALPDYQLNVADVEAVPGFEGHLWFSTGKELYRSTDGGKSARPVVSVEESYGIGVGKAAPGADYPTLYLSGKVKGLAALFRSEDEGKHWVRINDDAHQFALPSVVEGDPRVYGRVYLGAAGRGVLVGEPAK